MLTQRDALWYEAAWQVFWACVFIGRKSIVLDRIGVVPSDQAAKRAALTAYLMEMCGISYALRALFCLMVVWWHAELAAFCLAVMALYNVAPLLLILRHKILFPPGVRELSLCVPVVEGGLCALAYAYART